MEGDRLTVTIDGVVLPCSAMIGRTTFIIPLENGWSVYVAGLKKRGEDELFYGVTPLTETEAASAAERNWLDILPLSDEQAGRVRNVVGERALHQALIDLSADPSPPH